MAAVEGEHEKEIGVFHLDGAGEVDFVEDGLDVALLVGRGDAFAERIDVEFPGRLILGINVGMGCYSGILREKLLGNGRYAL